MSLIKVAHQMFHNFLFSQRNKAAKEDEVIGVCVCVCEFRGEGKGWRVRGGEMVKI